MRIYNLLIDFFAPKEVLFIEDRSSLELVMKNLESEKQLAIDTEFIWRDTYFPKLSLIQVATDNKIYIFDCLSLDISVMKKVFSNKNILKIFHSIRGDSSVIFNCIGIKIENIFDTQIAEDVLAQNSGIQISYKKLVKKYFFKSISKSETNSDWERRPLKKKQLDYAAEDVRYLSQKTDLGIYFSAIKGMSDVADSVSVFQTFGGASTSNLACARAAVDQHYADAITANGGDFLFSLIGVIDDPFSAAFV